MMESSAPPQPPDGYLPASQWRVADVVFAFLAGIVGSLVVAIGVEAVGASTTDPIPFSLVFFGQVAASFAVIAVLSRTRGTGSLEVDTGLTIKLRDWWAVPAGFGLQIVVALVTAPLVWSLFPDGPPEQGVGEIAGTSETTLEQLAIIVSVAVAAPIVEEVIFRGMLLSALRRRFSAWVAVTISAAAFSLIHLVDWNARAAVPGLFLLGLVLGAAALRRRDLSLAIPLHSGVNLLAAISILWGDEILDWANEQVDQIEAVVSFLLF